MEWHRIGRSGGWGCLLCALICTGAVALCAPVAADASGDDDGLVPAPAPASSKCDGPGCADGTGVGAVQLLQLVGTGPGCADGGACFWVQTDFDGQKARVDDVACCQWFFPPDIDRFRSAKNRYLARKVLTGNIDNPTSCMDPGEGRAEIETSDRVRVGAVGSHC